MKHYKNIDYWVTLRGGQQRLAVVGVAVPAVDGTTVEMAVEVAVEDILEKVVILL